MQQPLNYFDLVIKAVRGRTPVPEFKMRATRSILSRVRPRALTMCGDESIAQLRNALETIHREGIQGGFLEAGVWRGGMPIIMRAFLQAMGDTNRTVWVADSFRGLPRAPSHGMDRLASLLLRPLGSLAVSRAQVEAAFEFFGLNDQQVKYLEGWFAESLSSFSKPLALVRLDGDYYESTRDALRALYPNLSLGGYVIVDDYNLPLGCKRAVDEYREQHDISEKIIEINRQAVYWRKERE